MGAFADEFGIRPWEWDLLAASEALQLIAYIDQKNREGGSGDI